MNLHAMASGAIGAVNPNSTATLQISLGSTTNADGTRTPKYAKAKKITAQIQSVSAKDLRQAEALNLQEINNTMYCSGDINGIVRPDNKGGDLITMTDGTVWLVTAVLEQWPDWVKVAVTLQNNK